MDFDGVPPPGPLFEVKRHHETPTALLLLFLTDLCVCAILGFIVKTFCVLSMSLFESFFRHLSGRAFRRLLGPKGTNRELAGAA